MEVANLAINGYQVKTCGIQPMVFATFLSLSDRGIPAHRMPCCHSRTNLLRKSCGAA
jgi:hypothetical protein